MSRNAVAASAGPLAPSEMRASPAVYREGKYLLYVAALDLIYAPVTDIANNGDAKTDAEPKI